MRSLAWRRTSMSQVVLVAVHALPDHPHQLLLQAGHLRGDLGQVVERHVADLGTVSATASQRCDP